MRVDNFARRDSVLLLVGFALVVFFSSYHLFESPETWMDEGLIIQSAQGLLHTGKAALPVAPGVFEPAWYITTGFPLTLPLAGAFMVFGVSLEVARLVMLIFLLSLYGALWFYARKSIGGILGWFGFFLLVFFGPLYGNGRNALGEIPGLLFILLALMPLLRAGELTRTRALSTGLCAGLAVAAKPIFILFLPALLLALLLRWNELELRKVFLWGVVGVIAPLVIWASLQFDQATFSQVLSVYSNPHDVNIGNAIVSNAKRFFTEMQPLYFFGALIMWTVSYGMRRFRRETVSLTEEVLLFFSVLICIAYLRTMGYYRYFFPAQIFTLLYLPQSLWYLVGQRGRLFSHIVIVFLCGLILFQTYETTFRSWTAMHYDSARTETLTRVATLFPPEENVFIYQAPEIVPFMAGHSIYQYVEITPSIRAGERYISIVLSGEVQRVITPADFFRAHQTDIFSYYDISKEMDSYVILIPKETTK